MTRPSGGMPAATASPNAFLVRADDAPVQAGWWTAVLLHQAYTTVAKKQS